jgi:oxaloacetate decarboxylase gamma subunit
VKYTVAQDPSLLMEGVNLMLLGMGIVFAFLILLVFSMLAMSRLAARLDARRHPAPAAPVSGPEPAELVAVITAAVHRYRASRT